MNVFLPMVALMSVVAASLTIEVVAADPVQSEVRSTTKPGGSGSADSREVEEAGLRISIRASDATDLDTLRLYVALENATGKDTVLNLGHMLANGKIMRPTAVRLVVTDSSGLARELHWADTRVAGRMDDYSVPLRDGSTYTLRLSLNDFWCPKASEFELDLKPGKYSVCAHFTGRGLRIGNHHTTPFIVPELFWTGELRSKAAQFEIGDSR